MGYLAKTTGPVPLVLDLRISHDRFGSRSDPTLNGTLHYLNPNDIDKSLNEAVVDKIRKYHTDYNNNPPNVISFTPDITSTSGRLHSEFIRLLFLQAHRETDRFFAASGVQSVKSNLGSSYSHFRRTTFSSMMKSKCGNNLAKAAALRITLNLDGSPITSQSHTHPSHSQTCRAFFHFRRVVFSSMLKSRVSSILAKTAALRINLNLDGAPITSQSHTHPSHSQTCRLLTSSLSLGVPVPRSTQCMRDV